MLNHLINNILHRNGCHHEYYKWLEYILSKCSDGNFLSSLPSRLPEVTSQGNLFEEERKSASAKSRSMMLVGYFPQGAWKHRKVAAPHSFAQFVLSWTRTEPVYSANMKPRICVESLLMLWKTIISISLWPKVYCLDGNSHQTHSIIITQPGLYSLAWLD